MDNNRQSISENSDVRSAATRSENTHRLSDFAKGRILKLAFELRNRGYSESYLKTLITALNHVASRVDIEDTSAVSELVTRARAHRVADCTFKCLHG